MNSLTLKQTTSAKQSLPGPDHMHLAYDSDLTQTQSPAAWNAKHSTVLPKMPAWDFQLP